MLVPILACPKLDVPEELDLQKLQLYLAEELGVDSPC